jgi:hypothetical protein
MRIHVVVAHPPVIAAVYHRHGARYDVAVSRACGVRRRGGSLQPVLPDVDRLFWTANNVFGSVDQVSKPGDRRLLCRDFVESFEACVLSAMRSNLVDPR